MYTSKSAYGAFFLGKTAAPCAKALWKSGAPLLHKLFMWLALKNRPWTADSLARRGLQHPACCPLCEQEPESGVHLLFRCVFAREVWFRVLMLFNLHRFIPSATTEPTIWWQALTASVSPKERRKINGLIILTARSIWLQRNCRVFDRKFSTASAVCNRIQQVFTLWEKAGLGGSSRGVA